MKTFTVNDVTKLLGEEPQPGHKPKRPPKVDGRLEQLSKETQSWMRLFAEVRFNPNDPLVQDGTGATDIEYLPELYDKPIEIMRRLPAYAEYGLKKLLDGKKRASQKAADAKKKAHGPISRKK